MSTAKWDNGAAVPVEDGTVQAAAARDRGSVWHNGQPRDKAAARDEDLAMAARALAHPVRIRILRRLGREGSYCGDLVELLGLAQSTVSHHLRILREAGLIEGEEQGPATCYRVSRDRCAAVCDLVREILGESAGM